MDESDELYDYMEGPYKKKTDGNMDQSGMAN